MIIHVVKPGDSLYSISRLYGIPVSKIVTDNEIDPSASLVVGQTIVIIPGTRTHTISSGESLYTIARQYGVSVNDILTANPDVMNPSQIYAGETLNIPPPSKLGTIEVNGYTFPGIDSNTLRKTLPNLTYLSIFSNEVNPDGSIRLLDNDVPLIQAARAAGVAPLMVITNIEKGGGFSGDVAHSILSTASVQDTLLNNVIQNMRAKNYYGLDIDFEYINPSDRENYNNFLRKAAGRLRPLGYSVTTALAPKTSAAQKGILYEAHDYPVHGALANHVILMTYEWGYTYGPPMAVAPVNEVRKVLNYAVTAIPRQKIFMGIPNYGYNWTLPYIPGTAAVTLSNTGAVNLARRVGAAIRYDRTSQSPFFNYYDSSGRRHEVWFEDARSIQAKLNLVNEYGLGGVSYWTIGVYFPQNWLVLNSMYNVRRVL